ncbi:MAG TPA: nuclear transport factor 2 family protein [Candidatus Saccharimonadales bacterium]|nr:nuclear transport factor 2 family protein [Candidatus Saccharimonadales bacterium]
MSLAKEHAESFAAEWIAAWNARDLPRVLSHYTDDFEMSSPFIIEITGEPSGCLRGKEKVRAYWQAALKKHTELHFELLVVFLGASSIVLHYRTNFGRLAAEVLFLNEQGLIYKVAAHYKDI